MATKPFTGKNTKAEEMAEARAVRAGKVTPKQYARAEKREEAKEGEKAKPMSKLVSTGKQLAAGKMSAGQYAKKYAK